MEPLQMAVFARYLGNDAAGSALPDAPVVPEGAVRWSRTRSGAAAVLRRVADAIAPAAVLARPTLASGRGNWLIRWDESPCKPSPIASA
jgi:hypothetical protein